MWFSLYHDANLNDALTLKTNPDLTTTPPATVGYTSAVFFNVDWLGTNTDSHFPGGQLGADLPGYYRVGQSTQAALASSDPLPAGVQYWQQDSSPHSVLPIG